MNAVLERKQTVQNRYDKTIQQYELWWADLGVGVGSEQGGKRPVVVLMGEVGCIYSPLIAVAPCSAKINKFNQKKQKTQVYLDKNIHGLEEESFMMYEQIRSISRERFISRISKLPETFIPLIENAREANLNSKWVTY